MESMSHLAYGGLPKFDQHSDAEWSAIKSQQRDLVDNDNLTPAEILRQAAEWERWAASKADNPSFSGMVYQATKRAQELRQKYKLRSVKKAEGGEATGDDTDNYEYDAPSHSSNSISSSQSSDGRGPYTNFSAGARINPGADAASADNRDNTSSMDGIDVGDPIAHPEYQRAIISTPSARGMGTLGTDNTLARIPMDSSERLRQNGLDTLPLDNYFGSPSIGRKTAMNAGPQPNPDGPHGPFGYPTYNGVPIVPPEITTPYLLDQTNPPSIPPRDPRAAGQIASNFDNPTGGAVDKHGLPLQTQESRYYFETPDQFEMSGHGEYLDRDEYLRAFPDSGKEDWQQIQDNRPPVNMPDGDTPTMAAGGTPPPTPPKPGSPVVGLIRSPVPGRTDRLPMRVLQDSYVIPADVVSNGFGQGNTDAGAKILQNMFGEHHERGLMNAPEVGKNDTIPIIAAGGEYVVHPAVVYSIGGGDPKCGHRILDEMVVESRKKAAKQQMKLPPPKRD